MAKSSPGASPWTPESGWCSAPTSLNAGPKIRPTVRGSTTTFDTQKGEGESRFFTSRAKKIQMMHIMHNVIEHWVRKTQQPQTVTALPPVSVELCNPAGLWEGATTASHRNEFWQQHRMVRSRRTEKNEMEGIWTEQVCFWVSRSALSKSCASMAECTNTNYPWDLKNMCLCECVAVPLEVPERSQRLFDLVRHKILDHPQH